MRKRMLSCLLALCAALTLALPFAGASAAAASPALWAADGVRNKIVVISDIHLGIDDRYTETLANRPYLVAFLRGLQSTADVRELVINGDFLDDWYLPVYYPAYTDVAQFYRDVIATNQDVFDELNNVVKSGIKLVYVPGNHDMLLKADILQEAVPGLVQARDAEGLGVYYTGDRNEIAIEHGHRYDVFSAPDTVTNAALCGNGDTILPPGYFYARYAATWVLEGYPKVEKDLPVIAAAPDPADTDQYGAYMYYMILKTVSERMTPNEGLEEKIFDLHIAGFNDAYSFLDFYPVLQADGTISAPVLFRNIQRTWDERQAINQVGVPSSFLEAVSGTLDSGYFARQAEAQYLHNPGQAVDVVVFGHTHVPVFTALGNGKYYVNEGTWIDHNTNYPAADRTFAVITTGETTTPALYAVEADGTVTDITAAVAGDGSSAAAESPAALSFATKALENYGDDSMQARYLEVSGLADAQVQAKLNEGLQTFCLAPLASADADTAYDITPAAAMAGDDLLSVRTYDTSYTTGAAYPTNSIRAQLFSLTTGEPDARTLWDFAGSPDTLKQLIQGGKISLAPAGADGELPEEIKAIAYETLAQGVDTPEFASRFFFGDDGTLYLWCEGEAHATGDYWLFAVSAADLASALQ